MRLLLRPSILLSLALLGPAAPHARADNPRISLRVRNATAQEAAIQLGRAAGVPVELGEYGAPGGEEFSQRPELQERASFDWSRTTLAGALRQLCERYPLRPGWGRTAGWRLMPRPANAVASVRAPLPEDRGGPPVHEARGVRLFARSLTLHARRTTEEGEPDEAGAWRASLSLGCYLPEGDGETVYGVENVAVEDDRGNTFLAPPNRSFSYSSSLASFPDEWGGSITLQGLDPAARRLRTVQGDLLVYRRLRRLRAEVPLPEPGETARVRAGDVEFSVLECRVSPPGTPEAPAPDLPPLQPPGPPRVRTVVRVRVERPEESRFGPRGEDPLTRQAGVISSYSARWAWSPYGVDATGRFYAAEEFPGGFGQGYVTSRDGASWSFATEAPLARLVWDLVERPEPEKLYRFRLRNLDLPLPAALPPQPAPAQPLSPDFPFREAGGGTLVCPVRVGANGEKGALLSLGLSVKEREAWGPAQWVRLAVDAQGTARLPDLRAGTYRVLRVYHPPPAAISAAWPPGRWRGAEVTVEVVRGKDTPLPPLAWEPEASPARSGR